MSAKMKKNSFGGSFDELCVRNLEREEKGEKPIGLIRRAFSSRKRKKSKKSEATPRSSGNYLSVPNTTYVTQTCGKQQLTGVRSNPITRSTTPDRWVTYVNMSNGCQFFNTRRAREYRIGTPFMPPIINYVTIYIIIIIIIIIIYLDKGFLIFI